MKFVDITKRAGRSLRESKARTILTSLAIGVGAFTITLSLAAGAGGRQYATDIVSANTNQQELQVTQKQQAQTGGPQEYSDSPSLTFGGGGFSFKQLSSKDIDKIAAVDGVKSVAPAYNLSVKYITRRDAKKFNASVSQYNAAMTFNFVAGNGKNLSDDGIVLSKDYIKSLGFTSPQSAIGQTVDLVVARAADIIPPQDEETLSFKINGVIDQNELSFSSGKTVILVSPNAAKKLYDYNQTGTTSYGNYMAAVVVVKDGVDVNSVKDKLNNIGYEAQTAQDLMSTIFQFINVLQGILIGFGALAVLTSVFGIINTQYISVLERTQQIGLMKALGMRRRDVGRLFKLEAAWIGFLGGAIGASLALFVGMAANPWISDVLTLPKGTNLLIFQPLSFAVIIIGLIVVSVAAGVLPARKATKLDPIEALRTE